MSSSSTDEKVDQNDQHDHEYAEEHGIPDQLAPPHIDHEAERRAVRKLDYSIIPMISMFYLLSFLVSIHHFLDSLSLERGTNHATCLL